jgi:hypothetical protein
VFRAHRSHLYQRLITAGRTHRAVTLFYAALAAALSSAAIVVVLVPKYATAVWLLAGIPVGAALWVTVQRQERRQRRRALRHVLQSS